MSETKAPKPKTKKASPAKIVVDVGDKKALTVTEIKKLHSIRNKVAKAVIAQFEPRANKADLQKKMEKFSLIYRLANNVKGNKSRAKLYSMMPVVSGRLAQEVTAASVSWTEEFKAELSGRQGYKDVYLDLIALENEFTVSYQITDKKISITTPDIVINDINLGPFKATLDYGNLKVGYVLTPMRINEHAMSKDYPHPHVQKAHLCEGAGKTMITGALSCGRLFDFMLVLKSILDTWSPSTQYVELGYNLPKCRGCKAKMDSHNKCTACGYDTCEKCAHKCLKCGRTQCRSCASGCGICGKALCRTCGGIRCPKCGTHMCDGCAKPCSGCQTSVCEACSYNVHNDCQSNRDKD